MKILINRSQNIHDNSFDGYRQDIDGLRAISIILVVVYHFFPRALPGGFIGVDIFFVISGFLITNIILKQAIENKFNFIIFYKNRINRIFPALLIVIFSSYIIGNLILQKDEFLNLNKQIHASTLFISNYLYLSEFGYFDNFADTKPLLHLWSLAIEEQFYIICPILLYFLTKLKNIKLLFLIIITLVIISFAINIIEIGDSPAKAFYSPLSRSWEILIGGSLAILKINNSFKKICNKVNNYLSISSFIALILTGFILNGNFAFPGWWALIPVSCALIIIISNNSYINKVILSNKYFVFIGLISYPLYLWHWPILVFTRIYLSEVPSITLRLFLLFLIFILSYLTYKFIEIPIIKRKNNKSISLYLLITLILISLYTNNKVNNITDIQTLGNKTKIDFENYYFGNTKNHALINFERNFRHECNFYQVEKYYDGNPTLKPKPFIDESCYSVINGSDKTVLLWGDSHAQMLNYGLSKNLPENWQILQIASSGCYPSVNFDSDSDSNYCARSNWFALEIIKKNKIDVVILAQSSGHNLSQMTYMSNKLIDYGVKKVIVMGPVPRWTDYLPRIVLRQLWDNVQERTLIGVDTEVLKLNENLKKNFKNKTNVVYFDALGNFCNLKGCLTMIGNKSLYDLTTWDHWHLTEIASNYLASKSLVAEILDKKW